MYRPYEMYSMSQLSYTKNIIYTRKAIPGFDILLLTLPNHGQRGAEPICGLGRLCQSLRGNKETFWEPGAFLRGGSR